MRTGIVIAAALAIAPLAIAAAGCFDASGSPSPPPDYDASHFPDGDFHDAFVLDSPVFVDGSDDAAADATADATADAASVDASVPDADAAAITYPQVVRADTPLSYWRLGEASGTVATDQMASTNGTYTGAVTLGAAGAIAGDNDTAANFDGATGYVALGNGFGFTGTAAMSFEAWVKPGTLDNSYRRLLSKETSDGNGRQGYLMATLGVAGNAGTVSFERWRDNGTDAVGVNIPQGQYSHLVATYDGATMTLYLNGVVVDSAASSRSLSSISAPLNLATYSNAQAGAAEYLPGSIDEVAIYNHALSAARVLVHYHVGSGM